MFCILFQMVDTWVYICVNIHYAYALNWVHIITLFKKRAMNK